MLVYVIYTDATRYIIPNWVSIAIIALYPIFVLTYDLPVNYLESLTVMLCVFLGGLVIFTLNIMGGGDIKLITALSLWIGWNSPNLTLFFLAMAIFGGGLAIFLLLSRKIMKAKKANEMPYGIAISASFLYLLWAGKLFII